MKQRQKEKKRGGRMSWQLRVAPAELTTASVAGKVKESVTSLAKTCSLSWEKVQVGPEKSRWGLLSSQLNVETGGMN